VICGIDGCGKSTQEAALGNSLESSGRCVHRTKNPSDWYRHNPIVKEFLHSGKMPCTIEAIALLAAVDRMIQYDTEISPKLNLGMDVICNRWVYSTFAYFSARGADMSFVESINSRVSRPDKAVLLTINPAEAIERIRARDGSNVKFEERDSRYLEKVQQQLTHRWPSDFLILDGMLDASLLAEAILKYVER